MKPFLTVLFSFILIYSEAQTAFRFGDAPPVEISGRTLPMPFAGGINSAQIQQMDVNGDGLDDLVIWDKNTNNLLIFENGDGTYTHRPMLSYYFPTDINGFVALVDYNQDGKKDLFTSSPFGIKVYKNITRPDAQFPEWEVAQDYLRLDNNSNVQANNLDIPAFIDVDGDGDIDIVTFNFASGDYLEYYQNTSMERKGLPDVDGFASAVIRWGGFEFCECNVFSFGVTCLGNPISTQIPGNENNKIAHAGGHSLLMHDFNGDGILDLLMGQDECNRLYYLPNKGTNSAPIFNEFFTELPGLGPLPEFPIFHAPYLLGEDLLISTNSSDVAAQFNADYSKSLYHYQNGATLTTTAFLQEDMLDLGENARPSFTGNAAAGELIVTANSLHEGEIAGRARRFNWATTGVTLEDDDFLQLSSLNWIDLQYQEYIASNNINHVFVSGVETINFVPVRRLLWDNKNGEGLQEIQVPEVPLRWNDHFEFYRYKGEDYMLLARQTGELIRFTVHFGDTPTLALLERNYLGHTDNPANRNLVVHVVETDIEQIGLFTVDLRGKLTYISDIENPSNSSTLLLQPNDDQPIETKFGRNTWISSIPDAFGGQPSLILGTGAGGLIYLEAVSTGSTPSNQEEPQINIYPNPNHGPLRIITSASGVINLFNPLGQLIWEDIPVQSNTPLDLDMRGLPAGVYFVHFISNSEKIVVKKIIRSRE